MDKFLKRSDKSTVVDREQIPKKKVKPSANRQYNEEYIKFGFSSVEIAGSIQPHCIICRETLSNETMVPSKLQRHLQTRHSNYAEKSVDFFKRMQIDNKKQNIFMNSATTVSRRAQEASYNVAKLVAKAKKPHIIAESLILPSCIEIVRHMFGDKEAKEIEKVPLSNNTISRRINEMSIDIESTLIQKIKDSEIFSIQVDESTDCSNCAQLMVFVRICEEKEMKEHYLFCKELPNRTTGEEIFKVINEYFVNNNIYWKNCISLCTDGAAAMTGTVKGLVAKVLSENHEIQIIHCFIHREALMSQSLPEALKITLNEIVKMVNVIKSRPLQSRLFSILCEEMGSEHQTLLFHTEVRWLSRGRVLSRVYELKEELKTFFENDTFYQKILKDNVWLQKVAYLADIYEHLNELNRKMQGKNENILSCTDKINGFKAKIKLWINEVKTGKISMFNRCSTLNLDKQIFKLVEQHLYLLEEKLQHYFKSNKLIEFDWVRNPFVLPSEESLQNLSMKQKEELIDLKNDRTLELQFKDNIPISQFWLIAKKEFPTISKKAIEILLPFATTYICEQSFSSMVTIKNIKRSCIKSLDHELRVSISSIEPNISKLCSQHQGQISH